MDNISNAEEVSIIEDAITLIESQQTALAKAIQDLTPLADDNLALREVIRGIEADNAVRDEALSRLRDRLPAKPPVENPTEGGSTEPVVPTDPTIPTQDGTDLTPGPVSGGTEVVADPTNND